MKLKAIALLSAFAALTACQPGGDPVIAGAATGAAIGAIVADDGKKTESAILGAAVGAAAGGLAGAAGQGRQCRYTYPDGTSEVKPCRRR
ncbi:MAG: hypothetical protein RLZZ528_2046 [Pseudomonadota bacterium]|jgi:uncharacterized protein YcfJ